MATGVGFNSTIGLPILCIEFEVYHQYGVKSDQEHVGLNKIIIIKKVKGRSRSVIQSCGCDQEGRKLSWKTRIKEVGFEVFPGRCDRGTIYYLEGEGVPENWGIDSQLFNANFQDCLPLFPSV